jgi:hypothetical protein
LTLGARLDLKIDSLVAGADTVDGMDVLADGDTGAFVGVDSARRRAFGATKQDAAFDLINGPLNHLPSSAFRVWPRSAATAQAASRTVGTLPRPVTPWRAAPPSAPR